MLLITILERGNPDPDVYRKRCRTCDSKLEYTEEDLEFKLTQRSTKPNYYGAPTYDAIAGYLICPICENSMEVQNCSYTSAPQEWKDQVEKPERFDITEELPDDFELDPDEVIDG